MDPDTDVYQTEQPQISYSFDFTAEQSRAIQSPNLLGREGSLKGSTQQARSSAHFILHISHKDFYFLTQAHMFGNQ